MRTRSLACLLASWLISVNGAQAGTLTSATWTTDLGFTGLQALPTQIFTVPISASGTSTASSVSLSLDLPPFTTSFFLPKSENGTLDLFVKLTQAGAQQITAAPSMATVDFGLPGVATVRSATHIAVPPNASMFVAGSNVLLNVPLQIGVKAKLETSFTIIGFAHHQTVSFSPWTAGTVLIPGLTIGGVPLSTPTATAMGSFALSAGGGGTVTLVAPVRLAVDGPLTGAQRRSASFATLELHFVPEAGTLLLLAAAAAPLLLIAKRRPQ